MKTGEQRPWQKNFDAFRQKKVKLTSKTNAKLAWYTVRPLAKGTSFVQVAGGTGKKRGFQFFATKLNFSFS